MRTSQKGSSWQKDIKLSRKHSNTKKYYFTRARTNTRSMRTLTELP